MRCSSNCCFLYTLDTFYFDVVVIEVILWQDKARAKQQTLFPLFSVIHHCSHVGSQYLFMISLTLYI